MGFHRAAVSIGRRYSCRERRFPWRFQSASGWPRMPKGLRKTRRPFVVFGEIYHPRIVMTTGFERGNGVDRLNPVGSNQSLRWYCILWPPFPSVIPVPTEIRIRRNTVQAKRSIFTLLTQLPLRAACSFLTNLIASPSFFSFSDPSKMCGYFSRICYYNGSNTLPETRP